MTSPRGNESLLYHQGDTDAMFDYEYYPTEDYEAMVRKSKQPFGDDYSRSSISSTTSTRSSPDYKRKDILEELSEEEMRKKIYKKYKEKGVIGLLKTQLRGMIYDDLTKKTPILPQEPSTTVFASRPEIQRACVS